MQAGFQVLKRRQAVAKEWVDKFASIPVANISDVMSRLNSGGAKLRPMHTGGVMCGPAFTVKSAPGDNLMTHMALNYLKEGDVLVVDAGGDLTNAIVGERMLHYCAVKKVAGVIIYGAIRDLGWVSKQSMPVYACGVTHQGPYKNGPGEINTPVSIGGMVIAPGDLVIGDDDGVLCIPYGSVETIYPLAAAKFKQESDTFADIGKGDNDEAGFRAKLVKLGCYFEE